MPDLRIPPISNDPSKVQLSRISHVYFEHPDLENFARFAQDFGFVEVQRTDDRIYYRGYGIDPYVYVASRSNDGKPRFRGPAFVAASEEDFEKASKLEGAIVGTLDSSPGKGKIITFNRPDDTFFHVIHGQEERTPSPEESMAIFESQGPYNKPFEKPRRGKLKLRICLCRCHISLLTSTARKISALPRGPCPRPQVRALWLCRPRL